MIAAAFFDRFFSLKSQLILICILWAALSFSNALVEIATIALLIAVLGGVWTGRTTFSVPMPVQIWVPLCVYLLLTVLSCLWSEYPAQSIRGSFKYLQQAFIMLSAANVLRRPDSFRQFDKVFIATWAVMILNVFWQYTFGKDLLRGILIQDSFAGVRVTGAFKAYGLLASYLILTMPYLVILGWLNVKTDRTKRSMFFYLLLSICGIICLYWTRTRGAFVSIAGVTFLSLIFLKKYNLIFIFLSLFMALVVLIPKNMVFHFDVEFKEQSVIERIVLWQRAAQVIQAKPLTGTGVNTYVASHAKYDKIQNPRVRNYYVHNGYLQMAAETGIPSLICLLLFLFSLLRRALSDLPAYSTAEEQLRLIGVFLGIFNFIVFASMDTVLHNQSSATAFWFMLGVLLASVRLGQKSYHG